MHGSTKKTYSFPRGGLRAMLLAAVDLVLVPESKVTLRELQPPLQEGKRCFHAIAEHNGRKVEAYLVL